MRNPVATLTLCAVGVAGHATLTQPMSRPYYKNQKGPCTDGGCTEPWSAGGTGGYSPCGKPRGEDYTIQNFDLSKLTTTERAQSTLHAGSVVELKVLATAHHKGHVIFGLCPDASLAGAKYGTPPTSTPACSSLTDPALKQACDADYLSPLDTYKPAMDLMDCFMGRGAWANHRDGAGILERSEAHEHMDPGPIDAHHKDRWYLPPKQWELGGKSGGGWPVGGDPLTYTMYFKVPSNLKCVGGKCLLNFFYWTANSCTGDGYNEYFSEWNAANGFQPSSACTGGVCTTIDQKPLGSWAMNGNWWHNSQQYPKGTCDARVDDTMTNTWARQSPERFWNCADVYGPSGGTPDPCAGVVCNHQNSCQSGVCVSGQCQYTDKSDGSGCSTSCGECANAVCKAGQCGCENVAEGTQCSVGECKSGSCVAPPSPGVPSPAVDCVATVKCVWGSCSRTCGGGTRTRTCERTVTTQPSNGGASCDSVAPIPPQTTESCNTQSCPTTGKSCLDPAVGAWKECTPASLNDPPKCCPDGYVCCGTQWYASCRTDCSGSWEQSFAAKQASEEKAGGMSASVGALLGLLGGLLCGGAGVFAVVKATRATAPPAEQV